MGRIERIKSRGAIASSVAAPALDLTPLACGTTLAGATRAALARLDEEVDRLRIDEAMQRANVALAQSAESIERSALDLGCFLAVAEALADRIDRAQGDTRATLAALADYR